MRNQITLDNLIQTAQIIRFHPAGFTESDFTFDERWIARQLLPLGICTSAVHMIMDGQSLEKLTDGSLIKLTVAKWLTPNDNEIEGNGIVPDVSIELTKEDFDADQDPQLDKALELLSIK